MVIKSVLFLFNLRINQSTTDPLIVLILNASGNNIYIQNKLLHGAVYFTANDKVKSKKLKNIFHI